MSSSSSPTAAAAAPRESGTKQFPRVVIWGLEAPDPTIWTLNRDAYYPIEDVLQWKTPRLVEVLKANGLTRTAEIFASLGIDGSAVMELDEQWLEAWDVKDPATRSEVMAAVRYLLSLCYDVKQLTPEALRVLKDASKADIKATQEENKLLQEEIERLESMPSSSSKSS